MRLPAGKLVAFAFLITTVCAKAEAVGAPSQTDRAALLGTAVQLREAILHPNPAAVASLIRGLRCTDTHYNRMQIRAYLADRNSILYQSLFDAPRFSRRCGAGYSRQYPATSEKAFFESAPNGRIEIESAKDGYAVVKFTSPKVGYYPREYTLPERGNRLDAH